MLRTTGGHQAHGQSQNFSRVNLLHEYPSLPHRHNYLPPLQARLFPCHKNLVNKKSVRSYTAWCGMGHIGKHYWEGGTLTATHETELFGRVSGLQGVRQTLEGTPMRSAKLIQG